MAQAKRKNSKPARLRPDEMALIASRPYMKKLAAWEVPTDLNELLVFTDVLNSMKFSVLAILNQPRSNEDETTDVLEGWIEALTGLGKEIVERARSITPHDVHEAEQKTEILLNWEMRCGLDNPRALISLMTELAAITSRIKSNERKQVGVRPS